MTKNDEKQPVEEAQIPETAASAADPASTLVAPKAPALPKEIGGPTGPEPTRYGDWERNGRVSDF
ncbi:succinate dehydrogenase assembly factor 4 [Dongia sp.]|uniref:succinate dehydrogenase assembly factor 4 n=1 Tax=Dongia sp. TaxID=1977262 RepID=UPI0035AF1519